MDLLNLVTNKDLYEFTENLNYRTNFVGDRYFPKQKSRNLKALVRSIVDGGDIPVMAKVHAFDAESLIGDRTNYVEMEYEKLLIKEKLNVTEKIIELFGSGVNDEMKGEVLNYIFDDASNLVSRVLTREEVANMEALSTGKITVKENGIDITVNYHLPTANSVTFTDWSTSSHDILKDLDDLKDKLTAKGQVLTEMLCNSSVIQYMKKNDGIRDIFSKRGLNPSTTRIKEFIAEEYEFVITVNDDVYKVSANAAETKKFYPDNKITFFTMPAANVGVGAVGYTPDELALGETSEKSLVTLTTDHTTDPVALWTKASALYFPVLRNNKGIYIATVN